MLKLSRFACLAGLFLAALAAPVPAIAEPETITGEQLDPATYGLSLSETMEAVIERDLAAPRPFREGRNGAQGSWVVPTRRATGLPHSGDRNIVNKWGDTRMGIAFPTLVDVHGAYLAGQSDKGVWTGGVRVLGYRHGELVQETEWFRRIGDVAQWFEMGLCDVDRIEFIAEPVVGGAGWYSLDDLTYSMEGRRIVLTFEDLPYRTDLTNTGYAGLTWERGTGEFEPEIIHAPQRPPGLPEETAGPRGDDVVSGTRAALPQLVRSFRGVIRGDAGSFSAPPDTDGAVGPNHYVVTVNRNFAVYNKTTGQQLTNVVISSFLPGANGDPRVLFDHHSQRWVVLVTDFDAGARIYLAVSHTDNPMGTWFKTSFVTAQGADASRWPDYPTLGVDAYGIYTAAYMVPAGMSIFAIDKAPLIAATPSLGAVTAFRGLPYEGAIQPAHTYGDPGGEYLISLAGSSSLRIRRVVPPLTSPVLQSPGTVSVGAYSSPPDAPALGSTTNLDTVDARLMMAVFRNGSIWTTHTVSVNGRAGCRWYEINAANRTVVQSGTVADSTLYYFFPSIMVNQYGHAAMAFTGSHAGQYAGCYYTGRLASDPLGQMAAPVQYKAGVAPHNIIDSYGRNRWGDYSYTTLDPADHTTFWTIQEYGHANDIWGTYVAVLSLGGGDCNSNGVPDFQDITGGTSSDCNSNGIPDECDLADGTAADCNGNGVLDDCDIASGAAADCNANGTPDSCDLADGFAADCNGNGIPDTCDLAADPNLDCNANGVPDTCELAVPTGLAAAYYASTDLTGTALGRIDATVDFDWATGGPWPQFRVDEFSVRWTGLVRTTSAAGTYTFYTTTDDGVRLWVNNQLLIDQWQDQSATEWSGTITLAANQEYPLRLEYYENAGDAAVRLSWQPPAGTKAIIPATQLRPGRDCDGNNWLDACDFGTSFSLYSPVYTPLGGGTHTFILAAPPRATSQVNLQFRARGDLNFSNETVTVYMNGVSRGQVFVNGYLDCVEGTDTLPVSMANWNAAADTGQITIELAPSPGVDPSTCPDAAGTYIQVVIAYPSEPRTNDCNGNGVPDSCDIAAGTSLDANGNGKPDECDLLVCAGDANCDGVISWRDIDFFIAGLNDNQSGWTALFTPPNPLCPFANLDVNGDNHVTWRDIDPFIGKLNTNCP